MKILLYGLNFAPERVGIGKYTGELASWRVSASYQSRYCLQHLDGVIVRRCPLWIPRRPSGLTRLLHLASFAFSSLAPLLSQLRRRPHVVFVVAPAFFCAPGALLLGRLCGRRTITWLYIQDFELDAAFELGLLKGQL